MEKFTKICNSKRNLRFRQYWIEIIHDVFPTGCINTQNFQSLLFNCIYLEYTAC